MIQKFNDFISEDVELNEMEMNKLNEAVDKISELLKNGEEIDEGILGGIIGGLTGAAIGPAIGRAICSALGITSGPLYNLFNSRVFTAAVAAYIGYK